MMNESHLLPVQNIPRPYFIHEEPSHVFGARFELKTFLVFLPLILKVQEAMPVLPLLVVFILKKRVDPASVYCGPRLATL